MFLVKGELVFMHFGVYVSSLSLEIPLISACPSTENIDQKKNRDIEATSTPTYHFDYSTN